MIRRKAELRRKAALRRRCSRRSLAVRATANTPLWSDALASESCAAATVLTGEFGGKGDGERGRREASCRVRRRFAVARRSL